MASALIKQRDYKHIAETYSEVNEFQVNQGKNLVKLLSVKRGDKVVDVGCGTGEITSFIASEVGEEGEVLGIDPDQERIKFAAQPYRFGATNNMKFMVGDSSSRFPHNNEEYYDLHYSNFVFQWLTAQEKDVYLKTAFNCLKPGGRIAILSMNDCAEIPAKVPELLEDDEIEQNRPPEHCIDNVVARSILEKAGFGILFSEYTREDYVFQSLETFLSWCCGSDYIDVRKIMPHKKEAFAKEFVNKDGTVTLEVNVYRIIASK